MKQIGTNWKQGLSIFGSGTLFMVDVVLVLAPPLLIAEFFLESHGMAVFDEDGFHWQPCVCLAIVVILLPIAFSFAQKQTGLFRRRDEATEQTTAELRG